MKLPEHDHARRRDEVRGQLERLGVEVLVVTHAVDVRWLTGLVASNGQVLVARDPADDRLWTDNRYAEPARQTGLAVSLGGWVDDLADSLPTGRIGLQAEHVTVSQRKRIIRALGAKRVVATERALALARRRKDPAELARLELACQYTDAGWKWLQGEVRVGQSEAMIARGLVRHLEDLGADGPAFEPIVASGPNSAVPHHHPGERVLVQGDLLKVDFGARVDGYHADCTRVLALGEPAARLREIHGLVVRAQAAGVDAATVGATAGQVHDASVGWLDQQDAGPTLHGVGHGVGLEIHETPILSSEPTATLADGFVVTVEPGIYLSGLGGVRIEDTIAVTASGPRRLTTCAHDLVVL